MFADDKDFIRGYEAYDTGIPFSNTESPLWQDGWNAAQDQDFDEDFFDA